MHSSDDALSVGNSSDTKPHKIITRQTSQHTLTSTSSTKNALGTSRSMGSSVSELPTFQSEHPASVTESQTSAQSMQTSVVTPSANRTAMITATRTSQTLDIKTSEKIPEPVATELDKWFRKDKNGIHPGAMTRVYVQNNNPIWVPSSGRRPVFEDSTGEKLQAQLYSLKKAGWIRGGNYMVLVVWNDAQSPVIIKGICRGPGSKSKKQPPPGRSTCRIWKGRAPGTTPAGFLKDSFVFLVRHDELRARVENSLEEAPHFGRTEVPSHDTHTDATDQASREPPLIQNIMHKDDSLPPTIKTSPRESIDLTNLLEHESSTAQSKRQKLNPSDEFNDTVISKSQMTALTAIPKTTLFGSNQLRPKAATAEATPFMRSNDDGSRAREPHQAPSYTSVHKSSTLNEYVMTHVEVQFVSPNGSVARTKPLKACDSLTRLLSHGKLAFGRLSTSGMILIICVPGLENPFTIVDGDTGEFNDFLQLLSDVARRYLDPEKRETLRIEVSEMSNEP
ncbi:hypothetical protein GJ744_001824 [Endocarpon pusillum]|uniref:Uncharacterized protein n=1 Tax=Endocarpon pusillum TaxID=364733 RepID=A0A8H7ASJ6_9EURO|nr:hypothetical protein GJ744_001824 [Endocarpon pusillum]